MKRRKYIIDYSAGSEYLVYNTGNYHHRQEVGKIKNGLCQFFHPLVAHFVQKHGQDNRERESDKQLTQI